MRRDSVWNKGVQSVCQIPLLWAIEFKNNGISSFLIARFMRSPADIQCTKYIGNAYRQGTKTNPIGNEMWPGEEVQKRIVQYKCL